MVFFLEFGRKLGEEVFQHVALILGERLEGEKVERVARGLTKQVVEYREIIDHALPRGGRCCDQNILLLEDTLYGPALVGIESMYA
jgi:hypothetical protein